MRSWREIRHSLRAACAACRERLEEAQARRAEANDIRRECNYAPVRYHLGETGVSGYADIPPATRAAYDRRNSPMVGPVPGWNGAPHDHYNRRATYAMIARGRERRDRRNQQAARTLPAWLYDDGIVTYIALPAADEPRPAWLRRGCVARASQLVRWGGTWRHARDDAARAEAAAAGIASPDAGLDWDALARQAARDAAWRAERAQRDAAAAARRTAGGAVGKRRDYSADPVPWRGYPDAARAAERDDVGACQGAAGTPIVIGVEVEAWDNGEPIDVDAYGAGRWLVGCEDSSVTRGGEYKLGHGPASARFFSAIRNAGAWLGARGAHGHESAGIHVHLSGIDDRALALVRRLHGTARGAWVRLAGRYSDSYAGGCRGREAGEKYQAWRYVEHVTYAPRIVHGECRAWASSRAQVYGAPVPDGPTEPIDGAYVVGCAAWTVAQALAAQALADAGARAPTAVAWRGALARALAHPAFVSVADGLELVASRAPRSVFAVALRDAGRLAARAALAARLRAQEATALARLETIRGRLARLQGVA